MRQTRKENSSGRMLSSAVILYTGKASGIQEIPYGISWKSLKKIQE